MILLEISSNLLSSQEILNISLMATVGIVLIWFVFFLVAYKQKVRITEILQMQSFFRTTAVIGVIASTTVLALSGRIEGELAAAILSGIVGYVLGAGSRKPDPKNANSKNTNPELEEEIK